MEKPYNNEEVGRREYSVNWIKACLFRYLQGKTDESSVLRDIESARRYGVTRDNMQIITESLPFDRSSERFKLLLKLLHTVWE
jgi:hypothetical protein